MRRKDATFDRVEEGGSKNPISVPKPRPCLRYLLLYSTLLLPESETESQPHGIPITTPRRREASKALETFFFLLAFPASLLVPNLHPPCASPAYGRLAVLPGTFIPAGEERRPAGPAPPPPSPGRDDEGAPHRSTDSVDISAFLLRV